MVKSIRIKIILTLLSILLVSCSVKKNEQKSFNNRYIYTNEIEISYRLKQLINKTKTHFKNKFKERSKYVVIEFIEDTIPRISIYHHVNLYSDIHEKEFFNDQYLGGTIYNGSIILIKNNHGYIDRNLCKIQDKVDNFKILYGRNLNMCEYIYHIYPNTFVDASDNDCNVYE